MSDQKRLIKEIDDWCKIIIEKVKMAGKELTEEVKTNSDPRVLEFVRSDYCAVIDKSKVGVMTESAASAEKRELSAIQEEEETGDRSRLAQGSLVIAKWTADGIWYNARIENKLEDGRFIVVFVDYGNSDTVGFGDVVLKVEDVPSRDPLDEHVNLSPAKKEVKPISDERKNKYKVGQVIVANWAVDHVWYNAKILAVKQTCYKVVFMDYGNEDEVEEKNIVLCGADIPAEEEDYVDKNVVVTDNKEEAKLADQDSSSGNEVKPVQVGLQANVAVEEDKAKVGEQAKAVQPELTVNTICYAKWSEDNVWYNARVEALQGDKIEVIFVNYGNKDLILRSEIKLTIDDIPEDDDVNEFVSYVSGVKEEAVDDRKAEEEVSGKLIEKAEGMSPNGNLKPEEKKTKEDCFDPSGDEASVKSSKIITEKKDENTCVVGKSYFAKWDEDEVWYRAEITGITNDDVVEVLFSDYGNSTTLSLQRLVSSFQDIPVEDVIDEHVTVTAPAQVLPAKTVAPRSQDSNMDSILQTVAEADPVGWSVGTRCIAKWSEDSVWYHALIKTLTPTSATVTFTDYGNEDEVQLQDIVSDKDQIPSGQEGFIDEHVVVIDNHTTPTPTNDVLSLAAVADSVPSQAPAEGELEPASWKVGARCIARWSEDSVWYNALISDINPDSATVIFTDYGNEDEVQLRDLVTHKSKIPAGQEELIDEHVTEETVVPVVESRISTEKIATHTEDSVNPVLGTVKPVDETPPWTVGDVVVARWYADSVWYNARVISVSQSSCNVLFIDYGNEDSVSIGAILKDGLQIPKGEDIDEFVAQSPNMEVSLKENAEERTLSLSYDGGESRSSTDSSGIGDSINSTVFSSPKPQLSMKKSFVFGVKSPAGLTVLEDGSVAVVSRSDNCIKVYSREGVPLPCPLNGHRPFAKPTDIVKLSNGKLVVRDSLGIQLFSEDGAFLRTIGSSHQNSYYGLAGDSHGNIITINVNESKKVTGPGKRTLSGHTDVFFFNEEDALLRQVEMADISKMAEDDVKGGEKGKSRIRHLGYSNGRLFVVDGGLKRIFTINNDEEADMIGEHGDFNAPGQIAFDVHGNFIIVDTMNNRILLLKVDDNKNFSPPVKVEIDRPLRKPLGVFYDHKKNEMYVSNMEENTVVRYKLLNNK